DRAGLSVADIAVLGMAVEVAEPTVYLEIHRLDSRQVGRIESLRERGRRRAARDHQDRVVATRRAVHRTGLAPAYLAGIGPHRQGEGSKLVAGDVLLHPVLGGGDLRTDDRFRIATQIRVPERVVANFVAVRREVGELAGHERRLIEETVGR